MNKKQYEEPYVIIKLLEKKDVITLSDIGTEPGGDGFDFGKIGSGDGQL